MSQGTLYNCCPISRALHLHPTSDTHPFTPGGVEINHINILPVVYLATIQQCSPVPPSTRSAPSLGMASKQEQEAPSSEVHPQT